jgi:uncharacterized protein involved in exopolysaccharide biosynthesis
MFQYDRQTAVERPPTVAGETMTFGLASLPAALWRRKWWPIAISLLFAGAAAGYATLLKDRYQATSQVLIDPRELRVLANDVTPNNLNSDSTTAYIESQARIVTSANMLRRIIDREGLSQDPEYNASSGILGRLIPLAGSGGDRTQRIVEQLNKNLWVRRGERTFIIDIAVTSQTPEKAARLANAFAQSYLEDQANARAEVSRRTSTALTSRLNELRQRVQQAEERVENYKAQKNIVGASGKLVTEEQLAAVNSQLAFAKSRSADARAKLEQIDSVRGQVAERGALPEAVNSQTIGLLRQQLGEAQRRVANLGTALGPMHPEYIAAQSALRDAQRGVADEVNRVRTAARAEFDRAQTNERTLQGQVDGLKKDTLSTSRDTVQLRELERDLEASRGVYQSFLQRARETSEQERVDTTNARIITTATPPVDRSGPPRRLMVLGAAIAGFALGLFLALLTELSGALRTRRSLSPAPDDVSVAPVQTVQQQEPILPVAQATASGSYAAPAQGQGTVNPSDDLMRLLRMLGQLERALAQHGTQR